VAGVKVVRVAAGLAAALAEALPAAGGDCVLATAFFTPAIFFMKACCSSPSGTFSASARKKSSTLFASPRLRFTRTAANGPTWRVSERSISASVSGGIERTAGFCAGAAAALAVLFIALAVAVTGLPCSACSIAPWNSRAFWNRSSSFLASARAMTVSKPADSAVLIELGLAGMACSTLCITAAGESARNGSRR
jgi:hypothetical protein